MIHVNIPDEGIKIEGTLTEIVSDVCTVLAEICDKSKIDPYFLIGYVKSTFLTGYRITHENMDEDHDDAMVEMLKGMAHIFSGYRGYETEENETKEEDKTESYVEQAKALFGTEEDETIREFFESLRRMSDDKDERSKETVQGTGRRARRRLH